MGLGWRPVIDARKGVKRSDPCCFQAPKSAAVTSRPRWCTPTRPPPSPRPRWALTWCCCPTGRQMQPQIQAAVVAAKAAAAALCAWQGMRLGRGQGRWLGVPAVAAAVAV